MDEVGNTVSGPGSAPPPRSPSKTSASKRLEKEVPDLFPSRLQNDEGQNSSPSASSTFPLLTFILAETDNMILEAQGKAELFHLDGVPLSNVKCGAGGQGQGQGLAEITGEVMKAYGLEFLNIVSTFIEHAVLDRRIPLTEVVEQVEALDGSDPQKLLIWVDDEPTNELEAESSFARALIASLLRVGVEPDVVLPVHDMDDDILIAIVKQLRNVIPPSKLKAYGETNVEIGTAIVLQLLRVGVHLALGSKNARVIIIDGDSHIHTDVDFVKIMESAEQKGHRVLFLRNDPAVSNQLTVLKDSIATISAWYTKATEDDRKLKAEQSKALVEEDYDIDDESHLEIHPTPNIPSLSTIHEVTDTESGGDDEEELEEKREERPMTPAIVYKMTKDHFTNRVEFQDD